MKHHAFTLAESTIVIFLIALIVVLGAPIVKDTQQRAAERQFLTRMNSCWALETNRARLERHKIVISANQYEMKLGDQILVFPQTLSTHGFAPLNVYPDGFVAPQTRTLYSKIERRRYVMHIQMGWGGYRVEKMAGWD